MLKGDLGLFRGALLLAGFFERSECLVFNDKRSGFRRLKLWSASAVHSAPQEQQLALEKYLREAFGDRIISMYFIPAYRWPSAACSLCIRLKD
jgi:hypothetical protein